jgi:hypothetical protein
MPADKSILVGVKLDESGARALKGVFTQLTRDAKVFSEQVAQAAHSFDSLMNGGTGPPGSGRQGMQGVQSAKAQHRDRIAQAKELGRAGQEMASGLTAANRTQAQSLDALLAKSALLKRQYQELKEAAEAHARIDPNSEHARVLAASRDAKADEQRWVRDRIRDAQSTPPPPATPPIEGAVGDGEGAGGGGFNRQRFSRGLAGVSAVGFTAQSLINTIQHARNMEAHNIAQSRQMDGQVLDEILSTGISPRMIALARSRAVGQAVNVDARDSFALESHAKRLAGDVGVVAGAGAGGGAIGGPAGMGLAAGGAALTRGAETYTYFNAQGPMAEETARRQERLMLEMAKDPMFQRSVSMVAGEADSRLAADRELRGRAAHDTRGFYGTGYDEVLAIERSLAGQVGVEGAKGLSVSAGRLRNTGMGLGAAEGALGGIFSSLGGTTPDQASRAAKLTEESVYRAFVRGWQDPRASEEFAGALARATASGPASEAGIKYFTDIMTAGDGSPLSVAQARARAQAPEIMDEMSRNPLVQGHSLRGAQLAGLSWEQTMAFARSSPTERMTGGALLTSAGVDLETSQRLQAQEIRNAIKLGGASSGMANVDMTNRGQVMSALAAWPGFRGQGFALEGFADIAMGKRPAQETPEQLAEAFKTMSASSMSGDIVTGRAQAQDRVRAKGEENLSGLTMNGQAIDLKDLIRDIVLNIEANKGTASDSSPDARLLDIFGNAGIVEDKALRVKVIETVEENHRRDALERPPSAPVRKPAGGF